MMHFLQNDTSIYQLNSDSTSVDSLALDTNAQVVIQPDAHASLFHTEVGSELQERSLHTQDQPFWVSSILVLCFILLAWGRLFYRRRLEMIFRAVFAKNFANQLIREGNLFNERIGPVLFFIYLVVMAMIVFQALPIYDVEIPMPPPLIFLSLMGFFLGLWALKAVVVKLLSLLFNTNENSRELLANMNVYNLFAGIVLLPLVSCMAFAHTDIFFYISLVIIIIIYTLRIIRELFIGITLIKFSVFHLFLYLCTLEILPLIVLAKILTRNMFL